MVRFNPEIRLCGVFEDVERFVMSFIGEPSGTSKKKAERYSCELERAGEAVLRGSSLTFPGSFLAVP